MTPAVPALVSEFNVSRTTALVSLTLYTIGLVFGPIFSAPLSEQHGRKIVYIVTAPIFVIFVLGTGFSSSIAALLVCRFLAGLVGSPVLAIAGGTCADLFEPRVRALATIGFIMAAFLGPCLGLVYQFAL